MEYGSMHNFCTISEIIAYRIKYLKEKKKSLNDEDIILIL